MEMRSNPAGAIDKATYRNSIGILGDNISRLPDPFICENICSSSWMAKDEDRTANGEATENQTFVERMEEVQEAWPEGD
ncbi:hypothetical protein ACLOJK_022002 [Asimina triloba]